jgi:ubiquinone/menaquinone biosynthesis C-methylase UbiE
MAETTNYQKHTNRNPIQRLLISRFNKKLIDLAKFTKSSKVLDVGCGEGFFLVSLARNKVGKTYEGVDNSATAIKLGKKMYPTLDIKIGDIYNLPYKDDSFDLLICTEVLEHLKDPKKALSELKRVTKKYVIFSVPNEPFFILSNFFRGKYITRFGNHPEHINHWTYPGFKKFLRKNGLKISIAKSPFPWTLILARK